MSDKAALIKGLTDALAYCDAVYESTTDVDFNQAVTCFNAGRLSAGVVLPLNK